MSTKMSHRGLCTRLTAVFNVPAIEGRLAPGAGTGTDESSDHVMSEEEHVPG